jgi:L-2-hydroxyglutarate oxidase
MARAAGIEPGRPAPDRPALRTVPFLGQYFDLDPELAAGIRGLVYPVPDPRFPFLGVHLTRRLASGGRPARVDAGPNAALAFAREGYGRGAGGRFRLVDTLSAITWPGTWRLVAKSHRLATSEVWRSLSRRAFAREAARLLPSLSAAQLAPALPGIRAQALGPGGELVDDYVFARAGAMLHVLNAPSPAATSSLAIADQLVAALS